MSQLRLPILVFIALSLALWLKADPAGAEARRGKNREPNSVAAGPLSAEAPVELKTLASPSPYEKLDQLLSVKPEEISWKDVKNALVELNISISPVTSELGNRLWKLCPASAADQRLAWVKATDFVVLLNRYVEEAHSAKESSFVKANRSLRPGGNFTPETEKYVTSLREALAKLPPLAGYTFRGTTLSNDLVNKKYVVGSPVTEEGFVSASINPATAYSFAFPKKLGLSKAMVEPLADGDVRLIYIVLGKTGRPVSTFSEYWAEAETLFANGTEFRVKALSPKLDDNSRFVFLEEK